jgi:N-acetylglutamate synthase-like GNAT family acetyltransferase
MQVLPLSQRRDLIPAVIQLLHDDWGDLEPWSDPLRIESRLEFACASSPFPRAFVAISECGNLMGTASVKLHELPNYPEKEHWLSEVYVPVELRGRGIGKNLVKSVTAYSFASSAPCLYLYTPDQQALYAKLGWRPIGETVANGERVTLMYRAADALCFPEHEQ